MDLASWAAARFSLGYLPFALGNSISSLWSRIQKSAHSGGSNFSALWHVSFAIGEGKGVRIWHDVWTSNSPLKFSFARLFNLASNLNAFVNELGDWVDGVWELARLLVILSSVRLCPFKNDKLIWKPDSKGFFFSVMSFCKCLVSASCAMLPFASQIWLGLAPSAVEILIWLICHGRLCSRDRLCSLGIIPLSLNVCPRCSLVPECISHIFLHCRSSWLTWSWFLKWWGLDFCIPNLILDLLTKWTALVSGIFLGEILANYWACHSFVSLDCKE
ncbi:hypothetical protein P3X46_021644 [Hevea brasiliensis]|uniref:Reverse transcriptase zinc-binding domain-containing protein n=1 Tax=Hevea brasiliensis TaxID=3981 RepID=A0ABQ9LI72_HEVBR|nr:hypothetical protein P3X46_021644 [Hevea brasiliensis]